MTTTFVTVIRPPKTDLVLLTRVVGVLARATRTTFNWLYQKRLPQADVKRDVCARFRLLARHWSGCRALSQAAARSWREGGRDRLYTLRDRLLALEERWPKDSESPDKKRRNAVARRKAETAIARIEKELRGQPRWCFGGRRLLRQGRLRQWRRCRDGVALFCGETGKTAGNQVAQWTPLEFPDSVNRTGTIKCDGTLRLRLPDGCGPPSVLLRKVGFSPAQQALLRDAVAARRPVTWRVRLLPRGKVQLCVTLEELEPKVISDPAGGVVAVDLNRDHLAVVDVIATGRVGGAARVALERRSDAVWRAARAVVARARKACCPIVLEHLDLRPKKAWLRSYGKFFAEVLSLFRSRQVRDAVEREARRAGLEVRYVDPAWTSELGRVRYRRRCRLGKHHAAALVIGRRGLGFGERLSEGGPFLTRTVECVSTTSGRRVFVQRLPAAWLQGGRRRRARRIRAPGAPTSGSEV